MKKSTFSSLLLISVYLIMCINVMVGSHKRVDLSNVKSINNNDYHRGFLYSLLSTNPHTVEGNIDYGESKAYFKHNIHQNSVALTTDKVKFKSTMPTGKNISFTSSSSRVVNYSASSVTAKSIGISSGDRYTQVKSGAMVINGNNNKVVGRTSLSSSSASTSFTYSNLLAKSLDTYEPFQSSGDATNAASTRLPDDDNATDPVPVGSALLLLLMLLPYAIYKCRQ
ncbi:MAG: hypothetical protein R3Y59_04130 [bacterium]